jgi:hypothetical protein
VRKLLALLVALAPLAAAQVSQKPPDAVVAVVGSTAGQSGANFKTELQLTNATNSTMEGWLVLQPAVIARRYELAPRATLSFADVVADLGATGLASLDILADRGPVPTIVARAYDDQPTGTTGATIRALRAEEIMGRNDVSALIVPRDLSRYRFNIGVRTLELGATIELTVRDAAGNERHYADLSLPANHFAQQPAELFVGTALRANESIEVRVTGGRAVVYGATVDNRTNDSSLQVLGR